ncbi:hypothetical protein EP073_02455 [Geovibrio thiophilus]|uniref:Outer membrane protein assembly factor BamE n=1 Tax=Geovibrio thiophilus TaxID=139438 RepID=A0A410JW73_9BACT|nr:hypothetical protein [Geovibrio thiophilus]QAR32298.1 hypothetical protein EP073_02455 [Geovibrio thiophilus]
MKRILLMLAVLISVAACVTVGKKTTSMDDTTYYTQYSFFYKAGIHKSANYREGTLIPINTPVKIRSIGGYDLTGDESFEIRTVDGRHKIVVSNDKDNSGMSLTDYRNKLLGAAKADLSAYPEQAQDLIRNGEAAKGMTKDMLLKALGTPPVDLTPSLNSESWIYHLNLFQKTYISFDENGMVKDIFHK